ncbi:hypothetical protein F5B20DRAFT_554044, partial [Whalleya microplaca]
MSSKSPINRAAARDSGRPGRYVIATTLAVDVSLIHNMCGQASKLAKEYEKQGGDYENEAGSKNEPKKGAPESK